MHSKILEKYLRKELENNPTYHLFFKLTKQEVLSMSSEEKDLIKDFAKKYYRRHYRIRPKSFDHFLNDKKYEENCKVYVKIPFEELIKRGILTLNEENGKTYWYLYGEKLDPKTYENIYRKDQRTFRTLLEELGIVEFMDKFDISIPPPAITKLLIFFHKGIYFDIQYHHKDHPTPTLNARYTLSKSKENLRYDIEFSFNINNPKAEDVYMIEELLEKLESDIELKVKKIISWIESNDKYQLIKKDTSFSISGTIHIKDYHFNTYSLLIETGYKIDDRSRYGIYVKYLGTKDINNFNITMEYSIGSKYLVDALETLRIEKIELEDNEKIYDIITDKLSKYASFRFSEWYSVNSNLENLPDISEEINIVMNTKKILYNIINEGLNKIGNKPISLCHKYACNESLDMTVKDLIDIIDWKENQTVDESALKINLVKLYLNNKNAKPDILSILISLAYLSGAPYEYLLDKANEGLEYIIGLAHRGRLRITENGIYLDGKKIKFNMTNDNFVKSVMELVFILTSEENIGTDVSISEKISI